MPTLQQAAAAQASAPGIYSYLMAYAPDGADAGFDAHVVASILAAAALDGAPMEGCGLSRIDLTSLVETLFHGAEAELVCWGAEAALDEEAAMVLDLLLAHRTDGGALGRSLAAMIARRAMEPNHLWEDLGLPERGELSRMLMRHFTPLASRNTRNMRWKRFFYRSLCEAEGFVLCTTPVCSQCADFALCFGEETSESRMAEQRREAMRRGAV
jgi:nitrogen fixation protein NifQ